MSRRTNQVACALFDFFLPQPSLSTTSSVQVTRGASTLAVTGTTLVTHYDADVFPGGLTVTSGAPDLTTTAYGMFADFLEVVGAS